MKKRLKITAALAVSLAILIFVNAPKAYNQETAPIVHPVATPRPPLILDLHSDILTEMYKSHSLIPFEREQYHTALCHIKSGNVTAQFFAVWVPPSYGFDRADRMIALFYQMLDHYSADMAFAGNSADLRKNLAAGKISAFLGVEGGEAIGADIKNVDYFYIKGVRYMSLTWNQSNRLADAAMSPKKPHHGLTEFGKKVVLRMNQLGMLIDVAHASTQTVSDILKITKQPVISSHTCCAALRPHPRNLTDNQIRAICGSGGVVGIDFHRKHLTPKNRATVSDVANHIDHLIKVGGLNCAAIGSDFDGDIIPPVNLQNAGQLSNLTDELLKRGYKKEEIERIYGLNVLRLMQDTIDRKPAIN